MIALFCFLFLHNVTSSAVSTPITCRAGQYPNSRGSTTVCSPCDTSCNKCSDGKPDDCTSCRQNEYMVHHDILALKFRCSPTCDNGQVVPTEAKDYLFCRTVKRPNTHPLTASGGSDPGESKLFLTMSVFIVFVVVLLTGFGAGFVFLYLRLQRSERTWRSHVSDPFINSGTKHGQVSIPISDLDWENKVSIGRGGFGEVFRCHYKVDDVDVAVKVFKPGDCLGTLYNEIGALCDVRHPHITKIIGTNFQRNVMLVMPLRISDLQRRLMEHHVESSDLHRYAAQIADAMLYLHNHKIIHCDLKAQNVLVKDEFTVEVSDFGLASFGKGEKFVCGTVTHMALEYLEGKQRTPHEYGDIWAYGVLIWQMYTLCRTHPYEEELSKNKGTKLELINFLAEGGRLSRPDKLDGYLWVEISKCFAVDFKDRPSFKRLYAKFARIYPMATTKPWDPDR